MSGGTLGVVVMAGVLLLLLLCAGARLPPAPSPSDPAQPPTASRAQARGSAVHGARRAQP